MCEMSTLFSMLWVLSRDHWVIFLSLFSLCQGGYTYVTVSNLPARRQPHSVLGALCMPAPSICFRTPRLLLGHPGSLMSVHDLICMHTQRAPLFNVPCRRLGSTTRAVRPYPYGTSRVRNQTRVVVGEVQSIIHCTTGPAFIHEWTPKADYVA